MLFGISNHAIQQKTTKNYHKKIKKPDKTY
jgi:hypothetical protein